MPFSNLANRKALGSFPASDCTRVFRAPLFWGGVSGYPIEVRVGFVVENQLLDKDRQSAPGITAPKRSIYWQTWVERTRSPSGAGRSVPVTRSVGKLRVGAAGTKPWPARHRTIHLSAQ